MSEEEKEILDQIQRLAKLTDIVLKDFLKKRYEDVMPEIRVRILELLVFFWDKKFFLLIFSKRLWL